MAKLQAVDNSLLEQLQQERKEIEKKWSKEVEKTGAMQLEIARLKMLMEAIKSENEKCTAEIFNLKSEITGRKLQESLQHTITPPIHVNTETNHPATQQQHPDAGTWSLWHTVKHGFDTPGCRAMYFDSVTCDIFLGMSQGNRHGVLRMKVVPNGNKAFYPVHGGVVKDVKIHPAHSTSLVSVSFDRRCQIIDQNSGNVAGR